MPHEPQTAEIHEQLLKVLNAFHTICIENDIPYSLHAGTLIGAVRENGFIPWDDDADVSLTRNGYKRFLEVVGDYTNDIVSFDRYSNKIPVLVLAEPGKQKVSLDIFVYDCISEKKFGKKAKILGLVFFTALTKTEKQMRISKQREHNRKKWQTVLFKVAYILGKPFSQEKKVKAMEKFAEKRFNGNGSLVTRTNDQYEGLFTINRKEILDSYVMHPFEDTEFMILENYDELLRAGYGDYMTPKRMDDVHKKIHEIFREE